MEHKRKMADNQKKNTSLEAGERAYGDVSRQLEAQRTDDAGCGASPNAAMTLSTQQESRAVMQRFGGADHHHAMSSPPS